MSSLAESQLEEILITLERTYLALPVIRLAALEQQLAQLWMIAPAGCTATFSGNILGCTGAGLVGAAVAVKDLSGTTLWSGTTTTGGAYSGSVTITSTTSVTVNTSGISGYTNSTSATKTLVCGSNALGNFSPTAIVNHAPTLNSLSNLTYCGDPGTVTVNLSGIGDGDGGTQAPLTVTATSSGTVSIPNPTVTYTSPNTTGSIAFTPAAGLNNCGSPVTISVAVTDSGGTACSGVNKVVKTFTVAVSQPSTPTLNAIGNVGPIAVGSANQTVNISGIGPGTCNASGSLSISATSSAPSVSGIVSISYTNPHTTGFIVISIGSAGTATITVTVTDGNAGRCGATNTKSQTFTVTVV